MTTLLAPFAERAYALLRIIAGAMLTFHGVQKIFGVLTDHQPPGGSHAAILKKAASESF